MEIKNRCIYFKDYESKLTYKSGEHIFPAGLGGIKKLPKGYVSHDFNNSVSGIETEFMRRSPIALPRQFYGPGKRGNLNEKRATKSEVALMYDENSPLVIKFGYISLGNPFSLPQLKINTNATFNFYSDKSLGEPLEQFDGFIKNLKKFTSRYKTYIDDRIDEASFLIGYEEEEKKWHLAFNNENHGIEIKKWIEVVLNQKEHKISTPQYGKIQPTVNQQMKIDIDAYFRVYAKTAFNFLAYVTGQEFVLQSCFDPIRDWIKNGGDNHFVAISTKKNPINALNTIPFPDESHIILLLKINNDLMAYVRFYDDTFGHFVRLCKNYSDNWGMDGFICDWKNRREIKIFDYIREVNENLER
ncbi:MULTISPECIES: hypothetical protein [Bacillus cereus group]|uniref:HNH endonuclease n=1 Tax=Bacillus thuringiensis TaxID=1428 RepID=A0AB36V896_BACTU|nr:MULTISPECIES: hypothetical protein [Bacillus cereus group]EJV74525.1 hypothetical protein IGE_05645 [Bacillus cereus HuB1-1]MED3621023.1 hypothetical protein [Bacillus thuringiensis]PGZ02218.1 hypothetical protein COE48_18170 [Bacillus thuringiensis]